MGFLGGTLGSGRGFGSFLRSANGESGGKNGLRGHFRGLVGHVHVGSRFCVSGN